jgi:hypothetical protein
MKRQDSNIIVSHHNPQHLLATELLYRMFDPYWHVRHGALLGITSLLQAWKGKDSTAFGAWPQDILARCLCVLALDRFADFASEATTAPVRLAAAQVVALLYNRAPRTVQESCRKILGTLATHPSSWEVRHGGLVAMQFLVVVERETLDLATIATRALEDDCDDVIAVAAEVLLSNRTNAIGHPFMHVGAVERTIPFRHDIFILFCATSTPVGTPTSRPTAASRHSSTKYGTGCCSCSTYPHQAV